ncbi:MAG: hypothetical protein ABSB29_02055 [Nitrososphaerales archaeon]
MPWWQKPLVVLISAAFELGDGVSAGTAREIAGELGAVSLGYDLDKLVFDVGLSWIQYSSSFASAQGIPTQLNQAVGATGGGGGGGGAVLIRT